MPTASVKPQISDDRRRTRLRVDAWIPVAVIASLIAIAVFAPTIEPGPYVGRVTVVNHSRYAFDVEVAGAGSHDWMLLETVSDHATTAVGAVFDQGATWTFRFSVQGRALGEVVRSRADLARAGWRVVVPDRFAATLQREGVAPTA